MNRHLAYIDILKCFATIMIVSIHFSIVGEQMPYTNITCIGIFKKIFMDLASLGVPLFFMINGALVLNREYNTNKIAKKMGKLYFSYIVWSMITISLIAYVNKIDLFAYGKVNLISSYLVGRFPGIDMNHLWFIQTLIAIYFLLLFIKNFLKIDDRDIKIDIIILFIISFIIPSISSLGQFIPIINHMQLENYHSFFPFRYPLNAMFTYFLLGGLLQKYASTLIKWKYPFLLILFLFSIITLELDWFFSSKVQGETIGGVYAGYNKVSIFISSLSFFILMMKLCYSIYLPSAIKKFITTISSNTLTIYYLNWILGYTVLTPITLKIMNLCNLKYSVSLNYIRAIIIVVVCAYIGKMGKKIPLLQKFF